MTSTDRLHNARPWPVLVLFAGTLLMGGCGTIFSGTKDNLTFDANVPGVKLSIDGRYRGELPLDLEMSRNFMGGQQFLARFEKEGFQTQEFKLDRTFNGLAILDISSPIISGGIDVATGALIRFSPKNYYVQMMPDGKSLASPEERRGTDRVRFALVNYSGLQKDIARGGGELLGTFAAVVGDGDASLALLVQEEMLRHSKALLAAPNAPTFVECFDRILAEHPTLSSRRM